MTKKIFWEDPYQTTLYTEVESVNEDAITVRETIFYAQSGGQESDHGSIGGIPVTEAIKTGTSIKYVLAPEHGLQPGDKVLIEIDWERRYRLMRHHFAAELILELIYQEIGGLEKIGAHIAPEKARIDFFWPDNITKLFPQLTSLAQDIVGQDIAIVSAFSDEKNERRYWEVPRFAQAPCGGTHLKRTGEVGKLSLKRKNIGKGKERIEVYATNE